MLLKQLDTQHTPVPQTPSRRKTRTHTHTHTHTQIHTCVTQPEEKNIYISQRETQTLRLTHTPFNLQVYEPKNKTKKNPTNNYATQSALFFQTHYELSQLLVLSKLLLNKANVSKRVILHPKTAAPDTQ